MGLDRLYGYRWNSGVTSNLRQLSLNEMPLVGRKKGTHMVRSIKSRVDIWIEYSVLWSVTRWLTSAILISEISLN